MKNLIRKLNLKKNDNEIIKELNRYVVIYRDECGFSRCDIMDESRLKEMLLHPKGEIKFIFKYEDRLNIVTEFEALEEGNCNEDNNI